MIQANELRLGNWVTFCHPKTEYNIQIPAYDIYLCSIGDRAYKGIPLTPEILEKAGFAKEDSSCEERRQLWSIQVANNTSLYYDKDHGDKKWYLSHEWNNNHYQNEF